MQKGKQRMLKLETIRNDQYTMKDILSNVYGTWILANRESNVFLFISKLILKPVTCLVY